LFRCRTSGRGQEPRVYLDADATLRAHVTSTVRACFAILRQIRSVRHCLAHPALVSLLRALVISKVDYCSAVLAGSPAVLLNRRCLHVMAPCYLAETVHPVSSCASRRHLRSADTSELIVPSINTTLDDRRPCVAGGGSSSLELPAASLPPFVRDAPSQVAFRREFKTFLFMSSFPAQWHLTTDRLSTYCSDD